MAWTTPLAKDTGMKVRIVADDKINDMLAWVIKGETTLCTWGGTSADLLEAQGVYATRDLGPQDIAYFAVSSKTDFGFAVRGDSPITKPQDIPKGAKVIFYPFLPKTMFEAALAWGNLTPEDVEWVPAGSISGAAQMLIDGAGDLLFAYPTTPANFEIEASPKGMGWVEMNPVADPEGLARFEAVMPNQSFGIMSTGVESAHGKWGFVALNGYMVRQDTDPELIYNLIKWMDENYDKFKDGSTASVHLTIDNLMVLAETNFKPLHDGTVRYLEELGLWTPAHEKRRQANKDLIHQYTVAYQQLIDKADAAGVMVGPESEEWVKMWADTMAEFPRFKMFTSLD